MHKGMQEAIVFFQFLFPNVKKYIGHVLMPELHLYEFNCIIFYIQLKTYNINQDYKLI